MDPTQELNEFLKSHPVENKQEVPQEVKDKLKEKAIKYANTLMGTVDEYYVANLTFYAGAKEGYQLAQEQLATKDKEIERLKGLIKDVFIVGSSLVSWQQFKQKNNL